MKEKCTEVLRKKVSSNMESIMEEIEEQGKNKVSKQSDSKTKKNVLSTSHLWKVSAVTFIVGFICHLVSFGTPYWIAERNVTNSTNIGIWNKCSSIYGCAFRKDNSECLLAVRLFHGLAVLFSIVTLWLMVLYAISELSRKCREITTTVTGFSAAVCIQTGTGIFGKSVGCVGTTDLIESTWAWSLAFSVIAILLYCVMVFIQVLDQLRRCAMKGKQQGKRGHTLGLNIT